MNLTQDGDIDTTKNRDDDEDDEISTLYDEQEDSAIIIEDMGPIPPESLPISNPFDALTNAIVCPLSPPSPSPSRRKKGQKR